MLLMERRLMEILMKIKKRKRRIRNICICIEMNDEKRKKKLNILMLAWRDIKHPQKGGAEIVTDIYLSHLAKTNNITLFASSFKDSKDEENYNNNIIRKGNKLSVFWHGFLYANKYKKDFDIIIDQVNTIPFFTPLIIPKNKRVAFFNQLCKNVWFYETKLHISLIGYLLESIYLKFYKNTRILTISESTKNDLIRYCWAKPENVFISEMQIDFKPLSIIKDKKNQFVYVGRLKKSKRVHDIIKTMSLIEDKEAKLYIIGDGDKYYKDYLNKLVNKLNLDNNVIFTGRISNQKRNKIMQNSKAILVTSVREGWGLIITEANANGTLAITYNVEGLRDANKTGIITKQNTLECLAENINHILKDNNLMLKLSKLSLDFAKTHNNWDKQCVEVEKWIKK